MSRSTRSCQIGRFSEHERLDPGEVLRGAALDQIAGHGERPAGKSDQRDVEPVGQDAHRVDDMAGVGLGLEWSQPLEIVLGTEGFGHHRPRPRGHVDAEPDGGHRDHDVGEEDGGVGAVAVHRLPGQFGDQLGPGDGVEDAARSPCGPVLGKRPAGLAHEPHRHPIDGQAAAGPDERCVVEPARGPGGRLPGHGHDSATGRDGAGPNVPTGGAPPVVRDRCEYCGSGHGPSLGEGAHPSTPARPVARPANGGIQSRVPLSQGRADRRWRGIRASG